MMENMMLLIACANTFTRTPIQMPRLSDLVNGDVAVDSRRQRTSRTRSTICFANAAAGLGLACGNWHLLLSTLAHE